MRRLSLATSKRSGFTLLETLMSLAILVLLAGGVYAVADGAIRLSAVSAEAREREMRLTNFTSVMRTAFRDLPYGGKIVLGPMDREGNRAIAFEGAPGLFAWLPRAQATSQFLLRVEDRALLVEEWVGDPAGEFSAVRKLPLLSGVRWFRWRSYEAGVRRWVSPEAGELQRPSLLELTLWLEGDEAPERHVFAVSRLAQIP